MLLNLYALAVLIFVVFTVKGIWKISVEHKRWVLLFALNDLPIEHTLDAMRKIGILKTVEGKLQLDMARGLKKFALRDFAETVGSILHHDSSLYLPVANELANLKLSPKDLKLFLDKAGYRHREVRAELEKALVALEAYDPQEGAREEEEDRRKKKEKEIKKGLKTFWSR